MQRKRTTLRRNMSVSQLPQGLFHLQGGMQVSDRLVLALKEMAVSC